MDIYKLEGNMLKLAPQNIVLDSGETILNFNTVANNYGYKKLISEPQPLYNER